MLREVLQSMRPHQWVKNGFVLAPLIFSLNLTSLDLLYRALIATFVFCVASGSVYLINDLFDREQDRQHPAKCGRPIASGRLPVGTAKRWAAGLLLVCVGTAIALNVWFALTLVGYVALNLAYSIRLKHIAFLDVSIIALGFLLRVLAGALAIEVDTSKWLIVCTFLLSLYLALGKRKHEMLTLGGARQTRRVLQMYNLRHIKWAMLVVAIITTVCYAVYTIDPITILHLGTNRLPITVPFIIVGLLRFNLLTQRTIGTDSPTEQLVKDPAFVGNFLIWGMVVVILIYLVK